MNSLLLHAPFEVKGYSVTGNSGARRLVDHAVARSPAPPPRGTWLAVCSTSKVCSLVRELITNATTLNSTVKPSELAKGQGLPVIPGVVK